MRLRLLSGIAANIYGQAVTVAIQIACVPAFLHAWGPARYGVWLVASTLPAVLAMADCGIVTTSGYAMAAAAARGDTQTAAALFGRAFRFVAAITAALASLFVAAGVLLPDVFSLATTGSEFRIAAVALGCCGLANMIASALDTGLRANGDYALGLLSTSSIRLAESATAVLLALSGSGLAGAAFGALAARLLGTMLLAILLRRRTRWIRFRLPDLHWRDMKPLCRPALAALAVPAGLAISLQGMTAVAGIVLPLVALPAFTATRTLTRTMVQGVGLLTHALMPAMAMAAGRGDRQAMQDIRRRNAVLGLGSLVPVWLVLLCLGPTLLRRWTGGTLDVDALVFAAMATAALLHGAWMSTANLLLALNRQSEYAPAYLAVATLTSLAGLGLGRWFGLAGLAGASLCCEAMMAALVLPTLAEARLNAPAPI